jgi:hypothetical protein
MIPLLSYVKLGETYLCGSFCKCRSRDHILFGVQAQIQRYLKQRRKLAPRDEFENVPA